MAASATGPVLRSGWCGWGIPPRRGWAPATPTTRCPVASRRRWADRSSCTDLAVSGARVGDVVDDQVAGLDELHPDVVLVSVGANDAVHLTSRADFRSGYEALLAAVPDGALVVLLGVPDMGAPPRYLQPLRGLAAFRGRQMDGVSRSVARDHDAVYVDIAGETGPTTRSDTGRYLAADEYHPSDDGYALWAAAVLEQLRPALAERVA